MLVNNLDEPINHTWNLFRDTILIPSEMDQLREHVGKMRDLKKTRIGQLGEMQIELDHLCKVLEDEPQSGKRRV